jgi:hypothetical protein
LAGDLVEAFPGRSAGWFWRQVLTAIVVGLVAEARLRSALIVYALAGSLWMALVAEPITRMPVMVKLWVVTASLPWPLSSLYDFGFQAALCSLVVLPILGGVLLWQREFAWTRMLVSFFIGVALIGVANAVTIVWLSRYPVTTHFEAYVLTGVGISRVFLALLVSAWLGCRWAPRSEGKSDVGVRG